LNPYIYSSAHAYEYELMNMKTESCW